MKFKYIIIVLSIGSLFGLYGLSLFSQPLYVSLATIPRFEGQTVIVQGRVTEYRTTTYGSQLITIQDIRNGTDPLLLFIEGTMVIEYGDIIQVTGVVQQYKNQWELVVNNPQFVTVIEKWGNQSFPLWQIAECPEKYKGTNVNVTGIVSRLEHSSFILCSPDAAYALEVFYEKDCPHEFSQDDEVIVKARCTYDASTLHYLLLVNDQTHGIWRRGR